MEEILQLRVKRTYICDVLVVGGGVSGFSAASALLVKGWM